MSRLKVLQQELKQIADQNWASNYQRFFKTKTGQYAAKDRFLGVSVPKQRQLAKKFYQLNLSEIIQLLNSPWHEFRFTALIILIIKYQSAHQEEKDKIIKLYLQYLNRINNWDLVDLSAPKILGDYLLNLKQSEVKKILMKLVNSSNFWQRRIAIVATQAFIKKGKSELTFSIVRQLINDPEDLIHKANGWMLREVDKYCGRKVLISFLDQEINYLDRTTLHYALEHFTEK